MSFEKEFEISIETVEIHPYLYIDDDGDVTFNTTYINANNITDVVVPATVNGKKAISLHKNATSGFSYGNMAMTTLTIENGIEYLGMVCYGVGLKMTMHVPNSVTEHDGVAVIGTNSVASTIIVDNYQSVLPYIGLFDGRSAHNVTYLRTE